MIPQERLPIPYNELRNAYKSFLDGWDWEVHATLTFKKRPSFPEAFKEAKQWLKRIKKKYPKLKFAGLLFISRPNKFTLHPHIHCLLVSDPNYPDSLSDILKRRTLERMWDYKCKITTPDDWTNETLAGYISKSKNITLHKPDNWNVYDYRPNLLKTLCKENIRNRVFGFKQPSP